MTPQERAERAAEYLDKAHKNFGNHYLAPEQFALLAQAEVALATLEAGLQAQDQALSFLSDLEQDLDAADEGSWLSEYLGPRKKAVPHIWERSQTARTSGTSPTIPEHLLKRSKEARERAAKDHQQ